MRFPISFLIAGESRFAVQGEPKQVVVRGRQEKNVNIQVVGAARSLLPGGFARFGSEHCDLVEAGPAGRPGIFH
jgi:hypothetical protein